MLARMWRCVALAGALGLLGVASRGQQPAPGGSVTGTVILGDTQHPARFATVMLMPVSTATVTDRGQRDGGFGGGMVRTGIDGTFTVSNVSAGDYYVLANVPGYISERAVLQAAADAGASAADLASLMPTVHVSAGGSGSAVVTLQRGGSIGGRLQWEDGSPATGIQVTILSAATEPALPAEYASIRNFDAGAFVRTDDRGAFRVVGLASGDYLLQASISPSSSGFASGGFGRDFGTTIRVYAPGVFHKAEAKPITVHAGDDRDDVRMVLNLGSLRTVSGHVSTAVAGLSVLSGRASVVDSDGGVLMSGVINASGDFSIGFVPPGTYTLTVAGSTQAASVRGRGGRGQTTSASAAFKPYTQTLTVGDTDVTGLGINLVSASSQ